MVTFRLTMPDQWQRFMQVVLGPDVADELSNKVLVVCSRPKDGFIEVPLEDHEARVLVEAVERAGLTDLAETLRTY